MSDQQLAPTAFEALLDYEQRSLAHVAGLPEQIDAPGLWRGIAFKVSGKLMVSSIADVNEILTYPTLTFVPGTQPWLLGVANVRGNLVPVVDLRGFVEGEKNTHNERSRVLVVKQQGGNVGLLVDEVLGQRSFVDENEAVGVEEEDERYRRYVPKQFDLGGVRYRNFSVQALVRNREFVQAAA
jgi:twitching motility protein PilI